MLFYLVGKDFNFEEMNSPSSSPGFATVDNYILGTSYQ